MSHFTVLVVGPKTHEEIEEALYPYWELDLSAEDAKVDPRSEFCVECSLADATQKWEDYKSGCPNTEQYNYAFKTFFEPNHEKEDFLNPDRNTFRVDRGDRKGRWTHKDKEAFEAWCAENGLDSWSVMYGHEEGKYDNVFAYMQEYEGYPYDEDEQAFGYYRNPNAKWDWYQIGGRWDGFFKLKEDAKLNSPVLVQGQKSWTMEDEVIPDDRVDMIQLCDIDFEGMKVDNMKKAEGWWKEAWEKHPGRTEPPTEKEIESVLNEQGWKDRVKRQKHKDEMTEEEYREAAIENIMDRGKSFRDFMFGIRENDTKETYVERCSATSTFAVIKDGKWYEKGEMGWWGCVSDEKDGEDWEEQFSALMEDLPQDTYLTLIDCHI